jgi:hypothetical protein
VSEVKQRKSARSEPKVSEVKKTGRFSR